MRFVRVHRSAVVNIESILQLEAKSHGEFDVVLKNGSRSRVSRTYRAHLEKRWVSHCRPNWDARKSQMATRDGAGPEFRRAGSK